MKTLLQLLHQYKGDIEQRIECIEYDRDNDEAAQNDGEYYDDYEPQIAHWQATLKQIDKVLDRYKARISVKLISVLYEWVCPDCNNLNKGSSIDGGINCSGCNKPFKINFTNTP